MNLTKYTGSAFGKLQNTDGRHWEEPNINFTVGKFRNKF